MIHKPIIRHFAAAALCATFIAGCSRTPAKAPGSNPEDMTPEGHRAAARQEEQQAAAHERESEAVAPSKPNTEFTQKAPHEQKAEQHREFAAQHERAAEAAEKK